jgi:hypothetical protein
VKEFQATTPGRLRVASTGSKMLYTAFALAAIVGLFVSFRLYGAAVGEGGPAAYYAGEPVRVAKPARDAGDPVLDLPDEVTRPRAITVLIPERKLLEVTHFHLFTIPVYVLILAHLFLLAKIPVWLQNGGTALAIVSSGLHIAAPWLVRGSPGLAWLMPVSGVTMMVTLGLMALVATVDMWLPAPSPADMLAELRRRKGEGGGGTRG